MADEPLLFDASEMPPAALTPQSSVQALKYPLWTEHKATLIFRYLYYFVMITKHGTYIDGFSGPQNEFPSMWAAKLVLESEPRWLRHFHLVELDKRKIPALEALKASADGVRCRPRRTVQIYNGDFNEVIARILGTQTIRPKEAAFCLLDQRTFECHWKTLELIARYKPAGQHRIELFYFLSNSWLDRALSATKDDSTLLAWWGKANARKTLLGILPNERARLFAARIQGELGYASVLPWPIYERQGGERIMYYMIHATDHPAAPKLMRRAYTRAVDPLEPIEQLRLTLEDPTEQTT